MQGATPEKCDGQDNDCDGLTDDGLGTATCGVGICLHSVENCVNGQPQPCDPMLGSKAESCNGVDDDCDGVVDDGLGTTTCGKGKCTHTVDNCANGQPQSCNPMEGAVAETCNNVDDDCDGVVDNGLGTTTCGVGKCKHTVNNCSNGQPQTCNPMEGAVAEVCGNSIDDDCDGQTDEGCWSPPPVGYSENSYGGPWKVCRADNSTAWIAGMQYAIFDAVAICQKLGYTGVDKYGGTCGTVCGYCGNNNETYDGAGASCGFPPKLCYTVHWRCYK
jgi:hypothetical protein